MVMMILFVVKLQLTTAVQQSNMENRGPQEKKVVVVQSLDEM